IAAGTAAMAKRSAPSSNGPNACRPARMAGKAEAHPTTVMAIAIAARPSSRRVLPIVVATFIGPVPRKIFAILLRRRNRHPFQAVDKRADRPSAVSMAHNFGPLLPLETLRAFDAAA